MEHIYIMHTMNFIWSNKTMLAMMVFFITQIIPSEQSKYNTARRQTISTGVRGADIIFPSTTHITDKCFQTAHTTTLRRCYFVLYIVVVHLLYYVR